MSIKSIKEKELLVNFARAMGQAVDPKLAEEVDRINAIRNSVKASVSENIFKDLGAAVTTSKIEPVVEEPVEELQETTVPEIQFPVPPSLDELLLVLNEQIEEVKNELVQAQPQEEPAEAEASLPNTSEPVTESVSEQTIADRTSDFISKSKDSFQQPDPIKVAPDIDAITKKLRFLEQWISKVSMAGPGGGAVNLKDLDDVSKYSIATATNNQVLSYNAAMKLWVARTMPSSGGGIAWTDLSVTTNTANGNGSLSYDDTNGVFTFTPANVTSTIETLNTVTSRGNVTSNPITVRSANANYFGVNLNANYTVTTGQIAWNSADLTFDMGMANGVTLQVGQEQYIKVKAGSTITNGQAVMFAGANGEHIIAVPNNVSTPGYIPEWFIGIATQDIATNGFGYITTFGKVHNVNTLAWTEGDILYVDPLNIGELTNTEPQAPYPNIVVAAVTKRAGGDGHLMVRPTWRSDIHQLNDVVINGVVPGQVLVFDGGNIWHNQWVNTANVLESNGNLYYTNARVYANVIQLGFLTAANLNGLTNNTQLSSYATVANLNLKANIIDLPNISGLATTSNLVLKANVSDLTTSNIIEGNNLYYTNARVYDNVIQLGYITASNLIGLTNNTQLLNYATVANLNLKANIVDLSTYATIANLNLKANATDLFGYATVSNLNIKANATDLFGYATVSNLNIKANVTDLTTANVSELTNLYYTNSRVYANVIQIGFLTQSNLIGLTNNTQLLSYATVSNLNLKANITDLTTSNIAEGSNLYYTNARVYANVISLLNAKANVTDLATANVRETSGNLYFTNARVVSALTNTSLGNLSISYAPATTTGIGLKIAAANTVGGTGYADVLQLVNTSGGSTNPNKFIRLNQTGGIEIINSAYNALLANLDDTGNFTINGSLTQSNRSGFRVYGSGVTNINATNTLTSSNFTVDYQQGSSLNTSTGIYTAPITGLYQINLIARSAGSASTSAIQVQKVSGGTTTQQVYIEWGGNSTAYHMGGSSVTKLNAGDTLKVVVTSGTVTFDLNDCWSVAYIG